jgi:cytochrome c oxidase subunit 2
MSIRQLAAVVLGIAAGVPAFGYGSDSNLPVGATPISREVYGLHMWLFWICVAIATAVFGAMLWSIWRFHKSRGAVPAATLTQSTTVEIIWTLIPVVILTSMAIPAARTLIKMEDTRNAELSIKVTGYQWKWRYEYLGKGVSFYSSLAEDSNLARQRSSGIDPATVKDHLLNIDHPLVVPVDTKVRLLLTGYDVIHSWWVPEFAVKNDTIPGCINEAWFRAEKIGRYPGQRAELCGRDRGFMPIVVEVVSKEDFAHWKTAQQDAARAASAANADATTTAMRATPALSSAATL